MSTEYPTKAKRHCNIDRNIEEQICANRQELQVMQVRLESMHINVPELSVLENIKSSVVTVITADTEMNKLNHVSWKDAYHLRIVALKENFQNILQK